MEDSHTSKDCDYSGLGIQGRMNKITNFCHFASLESNRRDIFNKKNICPWKVIINKQLDKGEELERNEKENENLSDMKKVEAKNVKTIDGEEIK